MTLKKAQHLFSLLTVALLLAAVALQKDGRLWGYSFKHTEQAANTTQDTLRHLPDGTIVVNTTVLGKNIMGYGGPVPLELYVKEGIITQIKALENEETPEFFAEASVLFNRWKGKSVSVALQEKVDGISGATFSSQAIIDNVHQGLKWMARKEKADNNKAKVFEFSLKNMAALLVVLLAAIVPLFVKNKTYRTIQLFLNVVVLGFFCGSFLSYTVILSVVSNGLHSITLPIVGIMLVTAFVYPLLGKKSYYCNNICPLGALQELSGRCVKYKMKIKSRTVKRLDLIRQILWALLMLLMWSGVWFEWIDYEPFSAFIFGSASWVVISIAIVFVLLSAVVPRAYCRFVCPTGTLFKLGQSEK